jgi:hypothetical protein
VTTATSSAKQTYSSVLGVVNGAVATAIQKLDTSNPSSTASQIVQPLSKIFTYLLEAQNTTQLAYAVTSANAGFYTQYLEQKTQALALIFFLPAFFMVGSPELWQSP